MRSDTDSGLIDNTTKGQIRWDVYAFLSDQASERQPLGGHILQGDELTDREIEGMALITDPDEIERVSSNLGLNIETDGYKSYDDGPPGDAVALVIARWSYDVSIVSYDARSPRGKLLRAGEDLVNALRRLPTGHVIVGEIMSSFRSDDDLEAGVEYDDDR